MLATRPAQVIAKSVRCVSAQHVGLCVVLLGLLGCQRELDMAKIYDDRKAATTIRYIGVREGTRQFADYSVIRGTILTEPTGKAER
jgi:uncharacterized lipoprotein NlpE involved in copper resistance